MSTMASQFTSPTLVYTTVYSGADQRKHKSSASLAFVWGIHRWPVNSPHKWPVGPNAENVTIWWRHHGYDRVRRVVIRFSRFRINFDDQMTSSKMAEEISQNLATFRVFVCTYLRNAFPAHNQQTFVLLSQTLVPIAKKQRSCTLEKWEKKAQTKVFLKPFGQHFWDTWTQLKTLFNTLTFEMCSIVLKC